MIKDEDKESLKLFEKIINNQPTVVNVESLNPNESPVIKHYLNF